MWVQFDDEQINAIASALRSKIADIDKAVEIMREIGTEDSVQSVLDLQTSLRSALNKMLLQKAKHHPVDPYREAARKRFQKDGECEIDDQAVVSEGSDPGAYVMAWVWVSNEQAGVAEADDEETCRTCGETYADGGDGFDGECPSCADKTDQKLNPENYED